MNDGSAQLAAEERWLRGSIASTRPDVARRVEKILKRRELVQFLADIERHNADRKARFRLGPHLFQVIVSVDERLAARSKMPALDQPNAYLRTHFQDASTKSKALAKLLRRTFQPKIALAAYSEGPDIRRLLDPFPIIQSSTGSVTIVLLDKLLAEAAASLEFDRARNLPRGYSSTKHERSHRGEKSGTKRTRINCFDRRIS